MSKFLAYVHMHEYLRQWATFHYGNPVRFPAASVENAALRVLITKLPAGVSPSLAGEDKLAIEIPDSKEKPVLIFNHLTADGEKAMCCMIGNLMKVQLWNDLFPILDPCSGENISHMPILLVIRNWCKTNGIDPDYDYTIKMKWQRMREAHFFPMKVRTAKNLKEQKKHNKNC